MWSCPSITSLGTKEAVPCRKVWISLDNQGTASPQFTCGCSEREEEKLLFREAARSAAHPHCPWHSGTEHHLQLLLISRNSCLLDQTDQKFLCFHLFSFLFVGDSTLSSSAGSVLPLFLAGVWLWAQPGMGRGIHSPVPGLAGGIKLSLEGLSLGSHPQSLKSCRQEGEITRS